MTILALICYFWPMPILITIFKLVGELGGPKPLKWKAKCIK